VEEGEEGGCGGAGEGEGVGEAEDFRRSKHVRAGLDRRRKGRAS